MLQNSHTFYFISVSSVNSPSLSMKADSIVLLFFRLLRRFTWVLNCSDGGQHAPSEVQFLWGSSCLQCFPHTHQHTGIQTLKTFSYWFWCPLHPHQDSVSAQQGEYMSLQVLMDLPHLRSILYLLVFMFCKWLLIWGCLGILLLT